MSVICGLVRLLCWMNYELCPVVCVLIMFCSVKLYCDCLMLCCIVTVLCCECILLCLRLWYVELGCDHGCDMLSCVVRICHIIINGSYVKLWYFELSCDVRIINWNYGKLWYVELYCAYYYQLVLCFIMMCRENIVWCSETSVLGSAVKWVYFIVLRCTRITPDPGQYITWCCVANDGNILWKRAVENTNSCWTSWPCLTFPKPTLIVPVSFSRSTSTLGSSLSPCYQAYQYPILGRRKPV